MAFSWPGWARRRLAQQLDRLHDTLESLGQRLRESIAGAIGRSVAEAVHAAVQAVLDGTQYRYQPSHWDGLPGEAGVDDVFLDDDALEAWQERRFEVPRPETPRQACRPRWVQLLSVAWQAVAWFRNPRPRWPTWPLLGLALAAGAAAYAGCPLVAASVGVAGSVVSLIALIDGVRRGAGALAQGVSP